jgi:hypothetical protein
MKIRTTDSLPTAERRRVEALRLAMLWTGDTPLACVSDYFTHAEEIEEWIAAPSLRAENDLPERTGE